MSPHVFVDGDGDLAIGFTGADGRISIALGRNGDFGLSLTIAGVHRTVGLTAEQQALVAKWIAGQAPT